ncbi:hypothetical protein C0J09_11325 [Bordetella avium]|uniref:hypothetical protein n=1 Tax=Bordetella avium TaxID=521 RepID=UPI000FD9D93E|nr:hypothetical protein [Bordetella avium]AZY49663.1 hypothetical protein C0J09_11325 [Bordetella avium]
MALQRERILILAKTYPSPSASYIETSCVAGINSAGKMRRLFPVPFRLLEDEQRFSKWQWIDANIEKARNDHRPESFKIDVGTLECREKIPSKNEWRARREWIDRLPQFESFENLEKWSSTTTGSLALLCPKELTGLDVVPARRSEWSEEEISKLTRAQNQGSLLTEPEARGEIAMLNKLPCDFYYRYACSDGTERRHKIVDWEAGQLYRRCTIDYGLECDSMFKQKLFDSMQAKDMMLLMGNQHRFQNQWLIISLIYPPKPTPTPQHSLF